MRSSIRDRAVARKIFLYVFLSFASFLIIFPFFWMFRTSLIPRPDMFKLPLEYLPERPTFEYYLELWQFSEVPRFFVNSVIVATSTAAITLPISVFAGYSFARLRFPGREQIMLLILGSNMIPSVLLVIPFYVLFTFLSLINTYQGLIIAYVAFSLPFCTWMLSGYFTTIPRDLEDAAMVDGCDRVEAILKVILPLSAPGMVATAIFSFISAWSEFLLAYTLMTSESMLTATAGLASMFTRFSVEWGLVSAMGVLIVIPVLILFAFLQKYLVRGLTRGAVKG